MITILRIAWAAWWIGTILIVLSWFDAVPHAVGWAGFGLSCFGVAIQVIVNRYWRPPSKDDSP